MDIHINRNGQNFGPYQEETAREYLASGMLLESDLAWRSEAEGWKPLGEMMAATPAAPEEPKIRVIRGGEEIGPYSQSKALDYFQAGQLLPTDWGALEGTEDWKPIHEILGLPAPTEQPVGSGISPEKLRQRCLLGGLAGGTIGGIILAAMTSGVSGYIYGSGYLALFAGMLAGLGVRLAAGRQKVKGLILSWIAVGTTIFGILVGGFLSSVFGKSSVESNVEFVISDGCITIFYLAAAIYGAVYIAELDYAELNEKM